MNHLNKLVAINLIVSLGVLSAWAAPIDDKIAALKQAIKDEIAQQPLPAAGKPIPENARQAPFILGNLDRFSTKTDYSSIGSDPEGQTRQMLELFSSPAVRKAGQELIAEIEAERKARLDEATARWQALRTRMENTVKAATKPEDLDGILVDLSQFQGNRYGEPAEMQSLYQEVLVATEFTKNWQSYLSHQADGDAQLAVSDLQNLSQNNFAIGIIPRSRILSLIAAAQNPHAGAQASGGQTPEEMADEIVKNVINPDDMEPALKKLTNLGPGNPEATSAANHLGGYIEFYNDLKKGLPTNSAVNLSGDAYTAQPTLDPALRLNLLLLQMKRDFMRAGGIAPEPGDGPQEYVDRVMADALKREKWTLLGEVDTVNSNLNRLATFGRTNGDHAIADIIIAANQDAAGQFDLAVASYERALSRSDAEPYTAVLGEKLSAIRQNHPDDYRNGMQMFLTPPTPRLQNPFGFQASGYVYPGVVGRSSATPSAGPASPPMPSRSEVPGVPAPPVPTPAAAISPPVPVTNSAPKSPVPGN